MAIQHYLVYLLSCLCRGSAKRYVGYTAVLRGQSDKAALQSRREWHLSNPKIWLKGVTSASVHLTVLCTGLARKKDALAEEARETARIYAADPLAVRGGPWCRWHVPAVDATEIAAVAACTSRNAVFALAASLPKGSLACHLEDMAYAAERPFGVPSSSTMVLPPKRRSGRSGRSGKSGRSGVSGHEYRKHNLTYGTDRFHTNKYGKHPLKARNKAQRKYRAKLRRD